MPWAGPRLDKKGNKMLTIKTRKIEVTINISAILRSIAFLVWLVMHW
jgi:hypothetical protein